MSSKTFKPEALRAMRAFRRSKPWRGEVGERVAKFESLNRDLAAAYGMPAPLFRFVEADHAASDGGAYRQDGRSHIVLYGKLSVVTYLFAFATLRPATRREPVRWAAAMFARIFPRSFERCRTDEYGRVLAGPPAGGGSILDRLGDIPTG